MPERQTTPATQLTDATRRRIEAQLADPEINDQLNPEYMFSLTSNDLLVAVVGGLIDPVRLAHDQLANRGLDADGQWVGFDVAREIHGVTR